MIKGVRLRMEGALFVLCCGECHGEFISLQETMGGVPVGLHECPHCGQGFESFPETFFTAMSSHFKAFDYNSAASSNAEMTRLATSWYSHESWQSAMCYEGIKLGPPTEREIASYINAGFVLKTEADER